MSSTGTKEDFVRGSDVSEGVLHGVVSLGE